MRDSNPRRLSPRPVSNREHSSISANFPYFKARGGIEPPEAASCLRTKPSHGVPSGNRTQTHAMGHIQGPSGSPFILFLVRIGHTLAIPTQERSCTLRKFISQAQDRVPCRFFLYIHSLYLPSACSILEMLYSVLHKYNSSFVVCQYFIFEFRLFFSTLDIDISFFCSKIAYERSVFHGYPRKKNQVCP